MWAIYRKSDKRVVGLSADSEIDIEKDAALQEIVPGLVDAGALDEYDAVQVTDRSRTRELFGALGRGHLMIEQSRSGKLSLVDDASQACALLVTTDAAEFHPVDNVPLVAGGGEAFLSVQIQKVDMDGKAMERKKDVDELWLRTDHGSLRNEKGEEIRSVKLASGKAAFRIHGDKAKRLATVRIFNGDPSLFDSLVRVEFT